MKSGEARGLERRACMLGRQACSRRGVAQPLALDVAAEHVSAQTLERWEGGGPPLCMLWTSRRIGRIAGEDQGGQRWGGAPATMRCWHCSML